MLLPPAPIFDLSTRRVVLVDRYEARQLITEHRAGAVHPVSNDIACILWWSMLPDPFATMPTLRGPALWLGAEPTWRRILVIPSSCDRLRFEARARSLPPPERLARWYAAVVEGWRSRQQAEPRHASAAD